MLSRENGRRAETRRKRNYERNGKKVFFPPPPPSSPPPPPLFYFSRAQFFCSVTLCSFRKQKESRRWIKQENRGKEASIQKSEEQERERKRAREERAGRWQRGHGRQLKNPNKAFPASPLSLSLSLPFSVVFLPEFGAHHVRQEPVDVRKLLDLLGGRLPGPVPRPRLDPEQDRVALRRLGGARVVRGGALERRPELVRVQRRHPVVVVARHDQRGREVAGPPGGRGDVVQRRPLGHGPELLRVARVAKVRAPRVADREAVEAGHVVHPHGRQGRREQVRPLVGARRDERAAVGRALDRQAGRGGQVEPGDEVLGGGLEVVEHLLLLEGAGAGVAPGDTVLAAWPRGNGGGGFE